MIDEIDDFYGFVTVAEAARIAGVTYSGILLRIKNGDLNAIRLNNIYLVPLEEIKVGKQSARKPFAHKDRKTLYK